MLYNKNKIVDRMQRSLIESGVYTFTEEALEGIVDQIIDTKLKKGGVIHSLVGDRDRLRIELKSNHHSGIHDHKGFNQKVKDFKSMIENIAEEDLKHSNSYIIDRQSLEDIKNASITAFYSDNKIDINASLFIITPNKNTIDLGSLRKGASLMKTMNKTLRRAQKVAHRDSRAIKALTDIKEAAMDIIDTKSEINQSYDKGGSFWLSADPYDFLTMSTNSNNWTSCYSIKATDPITESSLSHGQTALSLAMGRDSMVLYVEDDSKTFAGAKSKAMRANVYINRDIITIGKFYPYAPSKETVQALYDEISYMVYQKLGIEYQKMNITPRTNMAHLDDSPYGIYCDIYHGEWVADFSYVNRDILTAPINNHRVIDVSVFEKTPCINCGVKHNGHFLSCNKCLDIFECKGCCSYEKTSAMGKPGYCYVCSEYE